MTPADLVRCDITDCDCWMDAPKQKQVAARWITTLVVWGFVIGCAYQFVKELAQ